MTETNQSILAQEPKKSAQAFTDEQAISTPFRLVCFPLLQTKSRRAIVRQVKKWGWAYIYRPRNDLVSRLSEQLGMTRGEVRVQLQKERNYLISQIGVKVPRTK